MRTTRRIPSGSNLSHVGAYDYHVIVMVKLDARGGFCRPDFLGYNAPRSRRGLAEY